VPDMELEVEVLRGDRRADRFDLRADPGNSQVMTDALHGWLEGKGYDRGLWLQFRADVRVQGKNKIIKTVRP
jgi:hypothetical protein